MQVAWAIGNLNRSHLDGRLCSASEQVHSHKPGLILMRALASLLASEQVRAVRCARWTPSLCGQRDQLE